MTVWLICPYGPIPGEGWRDYRYTMIGETLAEAGHDVIWWTSCFSHHFKQFRSKQWEDRAVKTGFLIRLVPAFGYKKNIGLARVWNELLFAWRVFRRAWRQPPPDLIVVADPPPAIGRMAVWLAHRCKCPLIFDVMDLWPELFSLALPKRLGKFAPLIFSPLYALRRSNHAQADGLFALSESYCAMMIAQLPKENPIPSAVIFNGIDVNSFRAAMGAQAESLALPPKLEETVRAVYAGSLGENYDILTLMKAALILEEQDIPVQIVIAGVGPFRTRLEGFIRENRLMSLVYVGGLSPRQLPYLYSQCEIGISAYGAVSTVAMPDKAYDYMAAGLPIVNSLRGELTDLLEDRRIGLHYLAGDPQSLADALRRLADDKELRAGMARRSFVAGAEFDRYLQFSALPDFLRRACQHYSKAHGAGRSSPLGPAAQL